MSVVQVIRVVLECEGCKAILGTPLGFPNTTEARAAAYNDGWRFPNRVNEQGETVAKTTNDVCPECIPGWEPRQKQPAQRNATPTELMEWK
jgi:hypothetical protein